MGVCGRASASGRVSHRVALDATAEEGDDDGCEGSDGIGKAVRRITGLPLSFESMVSNWKWRVRQGLLLWNEAATTLFHGVM